MPHNIYAFSDEQDARERAGRGAPGRPRKGAAALVAFEPSVSFEYRVSLKARTGTGPAYRTEWLLYV